MIHPRRSVVKTFFELFVDNPAGVCYTGFVGSCVRIKLMGARLRKFDTAERKSTMTSKAERFIAVLLSAALVALSVPVDAVSSGYFSLTSMVNSVNMPVQAPDTGDFTVTGDDLSKVSYDSSNHVLNINDGANVTITTNGQVTSDTIQVANNATVDITFDDVKITTTADSNVSPVEMGTVPNSTLRLAGENELISHGKASALRTQSGLTITSADGDGKTSGTLIADATQATTEAASGYAAGIGTDTLMGNLTIKGGTITAKANNGPGIGGGGVASGGQGCSNITITGGIVNASSVNAAGIGGMNAGVGSLSGFSMSGGVVTVSSTNMSAIGANLGGSNNKLTGGVMIVSNYGDDKDAIQGFDEASGGAMTGGIYCDTKTGTGRVCGNTTLDMDVALPNVVLTVPENTEITVNPNVAVTSKAQVTCGANAGFVLGEGATYTNEGAGSLSMQLSYDAGDGATPITPQTVKLGDTYTTTNLPTPVSTGDLYFTGWYTSADTTGTPLAVGDTIEEYASYTLYAGYSTEPPAPDTPVEPTVTPPDSAEPASEVAAASKPVSGTAPVQTGDAAGLGALAAFALSAAAVLHTLRKKH